MNDTLEKQLAESKEATKRLEPIERDKALAAQAPAIEAAIRKEQEIANLKTQCREVWSQSEQLLTIVTPQAKELYQEIESTSARLTATVGKRQRVIEKILAAGALAKQASRIQRRINELEGRPSNGDELYEKWREIGGMASELDTLPNLPENIQKLFKFGLAYIPRLGSGNF